MCLALNTMMGHKGAIVVDIDPVKRDAAKKAGALAVVDGAAPDAAQQIIKLTNGGAWAVIDYVGASKTVQLGVDSITKGGKIIVVGLFGGDITVSTPFFTLKAMGILGSYVGSLPEMKELLELVRAKGLPPVPLKTRRLEEVGGVLDELRAGKIIGRVVLTPAG